MTKAKSNITSLLSAINRKTPKPAQERKEQEVTALRRASGRRIHVYLKPENDRAVRELAAWLAGQGERPSDSLIIRTALSMAEPGSDLLEVYRAAAKTDGRRKQDGKGGVVRPGNRNVAIVE